MATDLTVRANDDSGDVTALANLPKDVVLLKMEHDKMFAVARTQPRDPAVIVGQLKALIEAYPAAADEAIYRKPVGTVIACWCGDCGIKYEVNKIDKDTTCPSCDSAKISGSQKVKKFAEGLSIRAAESIRSIYGCTRLDVNQEELENGNVRLTGTLVDYAACNITSDTRIVTPWYTARGGGKMSTPIDRFLNVVVKAEKAKLRRDVILDSVPNIVKAAFMDACEEKLAKLVAPEVIEQKILPAFKAHGLSRESLEKILGRPAALGWTETDRLELRKILSALNNQETTVRELLADLEPTKPKTGNGTTLEDLTVAKPQEPATDEPPAETKQKRAAKPKAKAATTPAPEEPVGESATPAQEEPPFDATPEKNGRTNGFSEYQQKILDDYAEKIAGINSVADMRTAWKRVLESFHPSAVQNRLQEMHEARLAEIGAKG